MSDLSKSKDTQYVLMRGMLSKFGYGDGNGFDDLIYDHYEPHPFDPRFEKMKDIQSPSPRDVLWELVSTVLAPKMKNKIVLFRMPNSCHNDCRAKFVDGKEIDSYKSYDNKSIVLEPESFDVPHKEIFKIAEKVRLKGLTYPEYGVNINITNNS